MNQKQRFKALLIICLLGQIIFKASVFASSPPNITGVYISDDGGAFYIRQKGNDVYWFAEHPGKKYAHVFYGKMDGNRLTGNWYSVPKYGKAENGILRINLEEGGKLLTVTQSTGNYRSKSLRQTDMRSIVSKLPKQTTGTFSANSMNDLDGTWKCSDGATYYIRQSGNLIFWFGEALFSGGQPQYANVFIGKRNQNKVDGLLVDVPKGNTMSSFNWTLEVTGTHEMAEKDGRHLKFTRIHQESNQTSPRTRSTTSASTRGNTSKPPETKSAPKPNGLLTVILSDCKKHDCSRILVTIYGGDDELPIESKTPRLDGKDGIASFNLPQGNYIVNVDSRYKEELLLPYKTKRTYLKSGVKLKVRL
ncbi:MAG: hypothetical protein H6576_00105 [Lewinellaceae bacterium]|nr:hypothetical protein [Saprospiraceae bacterium]MCB9342079.1 hypothetical protein [Lewinellaceae bacterium]